VGQIGQTLELPAVVDLRGIERSAGDGVHQIVAALLMERLVAALSASRSVTGMPDDRGSRAERE